MKQHLFAISVLAAVASTSASAQQQKVIPVRNIGPSISASTDTLKTALSVRGLSNGGVLVNDLARRRLMLFDSTLTHSTVVMDSASSSGVGALAGAGIPSAALIPYTGDSTLTIDLSARALLVLDATGKVGRVMALPKPQDVIYLGLGPIFGAPAIDSRGRLVYRGVIQPKPPQVDPTSRVPFPVPTPVDSGPIVRADFDTRTVDTLTTLKVLVPSKMQADVDNQGNVTLKMMINPMDAGDEWGMTSNGYIAVVRAHDYHIDWLDPDGTKRSTPKMPYDWQRLSDEQKVKKVDSMKAEVEKQMPNMPVQTIPTADGPRKLSYKIDIPAPAAMPDYDAPVQPGSVKPDLDGHLWITPHTSSSASIGLRYDVVDTKGEIIYRVQFPKDRALAGFGPGGIVYVIHVTGDFAFLERARLGDFVPQKAQ